MVMRTLSMRPSAIFGCLTLLALHSAFDGAERAAAQQPTHTLVACDESPTDGVRPPAMACAVIAHPQFDTIPRGPVVLRFETFPSIEEARRASGGVSAVVRAAAKVWLITLAHKGERSRGGQFVTEIGPVPPLPPASRYEMRVAEADFGPDLNPKISAAVHTHSGPELWYVLTGAQCLETPNGVIRARAGQGMVAPAETPMQLNIAGQSKRDAIFVIVHDASKPATTVSSWQPKGICR